MAPARAAAGRKQRPAAADPRSADPDEGDVGPFPIVGIGIWAGGLEAATEFLQTMPPDSGMGFVRTVASQAAEGGRTQERTGPGSNDRISH